MRTITLILLFFYLPTLYSQDSVQYEVGIHTSYFPSDLFLGIHAGRLKNRHEQQLILEVGTIKTFFQQRIFPQFGYQYAYRLVDLRSFHLGAGVRPVFNVLQVNRGAKNGYFFSEAGYATGFIGVGDRRKFRITAGFGPWFEQKYASLDRKYVTTFKWQYFGEFSFTYDL